MTSYLSNSLFFSASSGVDEGVQDHFVNLSSFDSSDSKNTIVSSHISHEVCNRGTVRSKNEGPKRAS